jgi:diguanylate cyclase (GGDEF)-like protein
MPAHLRQSIATLLERFLVHGTESASREDALVIRRGRGFALIGLTIVSLAGVISVVAHELDEVAVHAAAMIVFIVGGLALGFVQNGRWVKPTTHLGMGVMLSGIIMIAVRIGGANDISAIFPILLVLVVTYVLGVPAALFWTLASIAGVAVAVFTSELPPSPVGEGFASLTGTFAMRSLVLLGVFAIAAAERRFADQQSAELEYLARHDGLTGLYARRAFDERLEEAVARASRYDRRLALIVVDLDGFKAVNDRHGHAVGDALLRCFGRRLSDRTRSTDTAGRMGGDEFVILLEDIVEDKNVFRFTERLLTTLVQPVRVEDLELEVRASAGLAIFPEAAGDADDLLRAADLAMYAAKAAGGNTVRCHEPSRATP